MIIEDYFGDFNERMQKLAGLIAGKDNLILVGSSYGGLMAAQYALQNENRMRKMILLAPALMLPEFTPNAGQQINITATNYHGTKDDVVDPYVVKGIAEKVFSRLEHHLVRDDHSLTETFPTLDWKKMLEVD
ncbi:MAG: alpha/beta hydrolase [Syntrophaceae bacterium]|nr:alpha/beta hydrolase [Syntrophaceae bacterium]